MASRDSIIWETTELDLAMSLFRGVEVFIYEPGDFEEGNRPHWTVSVASIKSLSINLYQIETNRGPFKVTARK